MFRKETPQPVVELFILTPTVPQTGYLPILDRMPFTFKACDANLEKAGGDLGILRANYK